jgi:PAS domain S-box-containing protein
MRGTWKTRAKLQRDLEALRDRLEQVERSEAERECALNGLRESEDRYRALFEQAAVGVAQIETRTGRFLRVNQKYCEIVGYGEAELLAMDFRSITHQDDLEEDLDQLRQLLAGEISAYQTEKRYVHKQGHLVWIQLNASVICDASGKPVDLVAQIQDVTDRKQAETLAELAAKVDAGFRMEEVLDHVFEAFQTVIPFERIGCALIEEGGRTARAAYARSVSSEIELPTGYSAPLEGSSLQTILEGKRPRILNDLELYLREHPNSESTRRIVAEGMRSSLTCPLIAMGKPVGFLFFSSAKPRTYSEVHVEIYLRIAERLSMIIEKGRLTQELIDTKRLLETRNQFIKEVFGRYTSEEVASQILRSPQALKIGGETRRVTILMSDLRAFSDLCVRLDPQQVVHLLNTHLSAMTDVIMEYGGTIDEFLGDSILAIFGAPIPLEDSARRALACALSMQHAMGEVNAQLIREGLPALDLGIGVHTGEVVVGNIGSQKRAKYGIVGPPVNLASRIQACTFGGQILCSEATLREAGDSVEFDECLEVRAKGFPEPTLTFSVCGFRDQPELSIQTRVEPLATLTKSLPLRFQAVEENQIGQVTFQGELSELSHAEAVIGSVAQVGCPYQPLPPEKACPLLRVSRLSDLVLLVSPPGDVGCEEQIYARVTQVLSGQNVRVRFTSLSAAARRVLDQMLAEDHASVPISTSAAEVISETSAEGDGEHGRQET